ncbi:hypothetical protein BDW68DRAFT_193004 [Aspergillus falconensis]
MLADKSCSRFEVWRERKGRCGSVSGYTNQPTSVEVQVVWQGGQSSTVDLMPCHLQWAKKQAINEPTEQDTLTHMAYEASYLHTENTYYSKVWHAAILFQAEVEAALLSYDLV